MSTAPAYPSLKETFGTSVPVVTALLASLSTALLVVPLTTTAPGTPTKLRFVHMTPDQLAVLTASAAALLFIEATLCSIFAQASLPATDTASDLRRSYDNMSKKWYYGAIFCWTVGLPCLLVSLGALAHRSVTWTLPAAIIAAAITLILSIGSTIRS